MSASSRAINALPEGFDHARGETRGQNRFWTCRDGEMCVQLCRHEGAVEYLPHSHSEFNIVVCLSGEISLTQLGQTTVIGEKGVMATNRGVEHASAYSPIHGRACEAVSLAFGHKLLGPLVNEFRLPSVNDDSAPAFVGAVENCELLAIARALKAELSENRPGQSLAVEILALRLLLETLRSWPRKNIAQVPTDATPRLPRKEFVKAYEFMRGCRKEKFSLQTLCRFLGSSEGRFNRLFLASTNRTPAAFYNRLLMERAGKLLRDEEGLSIKEVGFMLGFKNSSHFISTFRKGFGSSPQAYRDS